MEAKQDEQSRQDIEDSPTGHLGLLVLSDLHVVGPDRLEFRTETNEVHDGSTLSLRTPLAQLFETLDIEQVTADCVVCCGDLTNRAGMQGFQYGWLQLEKICAQVGAKTLIYTPGNHDLDVRGHYGSDPWVCIKSAMREPALIPVTITKHTLETDSFEIYQPNAWTAIVNIDTNGPTPTVDTGKRGHLEEATIDHLERALKDIRDVGLGIIVMHHHPHRHGDIDEDDYSEIRGAPELLNMLQRADIPQWVIVHGHKHMPRIRSIDQATIISVGSLSGQFSGRQQAVARNQFYYLAFERAPLTPSFDTPVGQFHAWDWAGTKWIRALGGFEIPSHGGFGVKIDCNLLVAKISEFVLSSVFPKNSEEINAAFPELRYVIPSDKERLKSLLLRRHNIEIVPIDFSSPDWGSIGRARS